MRTILHADLNNFYASVECLYRPELRDECMVVGGNEMKRHGIVLSKNQNAKEYGIQTGESLLEARQKCRGLVVVQANYGRYLHMARLVRNIYCRFTNQVEHYGIDEAWLDLSGNLDGKTGYILAEKIRKCVKHELGLTISVGVSWNKVLAKFASDYRKPDATTEITPENMKKIFWPRSIQELLFVGRATTVKLNRLGIYTIGDLAKTDVAMLKKRFGKHGERIHCYANGWDDAPVAWQGDYHPVASVGNSVTTPRDLINFEDVRIVIILLVEKIAMRLREQDLTAGVVSIDLRGKSLIRQSFQMKLPEQTNLTNTLIQYSLILFKERYDWREPLRSIGVRTSKIQPRKGSQLSLFADTRQDEYYALAQTIDHLRQRYGTHSLIRAVLLEDPQLSGISTGSLGFSVDAHLNLRVPKAMISDETIAQRFLENGKSKLSIRR